MKVIFLDKVSGNLKHVVNIPIISLVRSHQISLYMSKVVHEERSMVDNADIKKL